VEPRLNAVQTGGTANSQCSYPIANKVMGTHIWTHDLVTGDVWWQTPQPNIAIHSLTHLQAPAPYSLSPLLNGGDSALHCTLEQAQGYPRLFLTITQPHMYLNRTRRDQTRAGHITPPTSRGGHSLTVPANISLTHKHETQLFLIAASTTPTSYEPNTRQM